MKLTERINFRQPKYMLPAIVYLPLLGASYFIFDLFDIKVAEKQDANMQTTEYLNPNLPQAHIKGGDGIGSKYENMLNAYAARISQPWDWEKTPAFSLTPAL